MKTRSSADSSNRCVRTLVTAAVAAFILGVGSPRPMWAQSGVTQSGVTVMGLIENHKGLFVSYATCTLVAPNSGDSRVTVADTLGRFTFQDIDPGSYRIETTAEGYAPRQVEVTVATKPIAGLRIVLEPGEEQTLTSAAGATAAGDTQIPATQGSQDLPPQPPSAVLAERLPKLWSVGFSVANSYDTNIDHNQLNEEAYGLAYGTSVSYRTAHVRPLFQIYYGLTRFSVPNADRWTRLSHQVRGVLEKRLNRRVYFDLVGDFSTGSQSEDREIVNQYLARPRVEFRLPRDHRLRLYTAYRLKRYSDLPDRDSTNLYAGFELQRRLESGDRWTVGYRYEENRATGLRYRYRRLTYETEWETLVTSSDMLAFSVVFRSKLYPFRFAEVDDIDVPRHNQRWIPALSWTHRFGNRVEGRLTYVFDTQTSNDLDEPYDAHNLGYSFGVTW